MDMPTGIMRERRAAAAAESSSSSRSSARLQALHLLHHNTQRANRDEHQCRMSSRLLCNCMLHCCGRAPGSGIPGSWDRLWPRRTRSNAPWPAVLPMTPLRLHAAKLSLAAGSTVTCNSSILQAATSAFPFIALTSRSVKLQHGLHNSSCGVLNNAAEKITGKMLLQIAPAPAWTNTLGPDCGGKPEVDSACTIKDALLGDTTCACMCERHSVLSLHLQICFEPYCYQVRPHAAPELCRLRIIAVSDEAARHMQHALLTVHSIDRLATSCTSGMQCSMSNTAV